MGSNQNLPFQVGELAESKSFDPGFRGAWFRCKIRGIRKIKGHISYSLEFFDFPDEKLGWTKLYQMPQHRVSGEDKKLHLMVRPSFPSIYRDNQTPDSTLSEVIAIVDDVRKVGDLVDWWFEGCYWSGRITQLLGEDKVKIQLPDQPVGEGNCYDAFYKDLRPSLDWAPERGWTVPISSSSDAFWYCARLVRPSNRVGEIKVDGSKRVASMESSDTSTSSDGLEGVACMESSDTSTCSRGSVDTWPSPKQVSSCEPSEETNRLCDVIKPSSSGSVSGTGTGNEYNHDEKRVNFSSPPPETMESSILALEELVNKIQWLKRVQEFGLQDANAMTPSWKFLEDGA